MLYRLVDPDFPRKNFSTLACSLSLNPPNIKPRKFFEDKMGVNLEYFQIRMFRLSEGRAGSLFELEFCTRLKFMLHFLNNQ